MTCCLWSKNGIIDPPADWQIVDWSSGEEVRGESVMIATTATWQEAEAIRLAALLAEGTVDMSAHAKAKRVWTTAMRRARDAGVIMRDCEHARFTAVKEAVERARKG